MRPGVVVSAWWTPQHLGGGGRRIRNSLMADFVFGLPVTIRWNPSWQVEVPSVQSLLAHSIWGQQTLPCFASPLMFSPVYFKDSLIYDLATMNTSDTVSMLRHNIWASFLVMKTHIGLQNKPSLIPEAKTVFLHGQSWCRKTAKSPYFCKIQSNRSPCFHIWMRFTSSLLSTSTLFSL